MPCSTSGTYRAFRGFPACTVRAMGTSRSVSNFGRRTVKFTIFVVVVLALVGCQPAAPMIPVGWYQSYLTRDGSDVTNITSTGPDAVRVTDPVTNTGKNSRVLFGPENAVVSVDHTSCATVTQSGWPQQEGVALRIRNDDGRVRAITVTKNIWNNVTHDYNIHLWDTSTPEKFQLISAFGMASAVGVVDSTPGHTRRLCARTEDNVVRFKVWPSDRPEPGWDDPKYSRTQKLPDKARYSGRPGYYIGHTPPGGWAEYTNMVTSHQDTNNTVIPK